MNWSSIQKPTHPSQKVTSLFSAQRLPAALLPGCRQVADCCWGGRTQNKKCQPGPCTEMMPGVNAAGAGMVSPLFPPPPGFNLNSWHCKMPASTESHLQKASSSQGPRLLLHLLRLFIWRWFSGKKKKKKKKKKTGTAESLILSFLGLHFGGGVTCLEVWELQPDAQEGAEAVSDKPALLQAKVYTVTLPKKGTEVDLGWKI